MRQKIIGMLPVLSVVILAALASREAHLARMGLSMLTLAILIGMLVGNTLYPRIATKAWSSAKANCCALASSSTVSA